MARTIFVASQEDAKHLEVDSICAPGLAFIDPSDELVVDPEVVAREGRDSLVGHLTRIKIVVR